MMSYYEKYYKDKRKARRNEGYKNGLIYKLVCNKTGLVYYGSTKCILSERVGKHRYDYKNKINITMSHKILEGDDWTYELVEYFPCKTRKELLAREQYYIDNNECINIGNCITKNTLSTIQKRYHENHREERNNYTKKKREYQNTWGEPINKLSRDTPNNLLLIDVNLLSHK